MQRAIGQNAASEAEAEDRRLTRLVWIALLGLLAVRIVALALNRTDLFFDEAQYWSWSTEPSFGYYSKPPLIAWLIGLSGAVCGASELCIRLPSPLLHTATAAAIMLLGRQLYGARVGAVAALVYATLPAVSFSSGIISTDVPLLLAWTVALIGFSALVFPTDSSRDAWWPAVLIGLGMGFGLNAKYAMAWFVPCAAIYLASTPGKRGLLRDRRLWAGLGIGIALIAPNLVWNAIHSFATFSHTADNAKWSGSLIKPLKALEFLGAQFGVFGPILFAGLLTVALRARRERLPEPDRLLLAFALPVLIAITIQALISRAHANWAAVSYVAATVLITATLLREASRRWLRISFAVHAAVLAAIVAGVATAGRLPLPGDPFARTLGWREVADATRSELARARAAGQPYGSIISSDRSVSAELLYYMRDERTPLMAWRDRGRPQDHFELTRPFGAGAPEPVLLVHLMCDVGSASACFSATASGEAVQGRFGARFERIQEVGSRVLPAGATKSRRIMLYALSGYRGK